LTSTPYLSADSSPAPEKPHNGVAPPPLKKTETVQPHLRHPSHQSVKNQQKKRRGAVNPKAFSHMPTLLSDNITKNNIKKATGTTNSASSPSRQEWHSERETRASPILLGCTSRIGIVHESVRSECQRKGFLCLVLSKNSIYKDRRNSSPKAGKKC